MRLLPHGRRAWVFSSTGRLAYVLEIRSTAARDTVHFHFHDERQVRTVRARSFLQHFTRLP